MKKGQSAVRYRSSAGEVPISSQRNTRRARDAGTSGSLTARVSGAKHQIHKVPFLRVGGTSYSR
jgi:hypothetical protein